MSKQKGIILKITKKIAVVMTADCQIISIKLQPGMDVGMEIVFNKNEIIPERSKYVVPVRIAAGIAAVFALLFVFNNSFIGNDAYAYVTVDSIASIEFEVDKSNKIIKVNTFDADTNALLKSMNLKHQPIDVAIREVIEKTSTKESTILISACLNEHEKAKNENEALKIQKEFNNLINACKSVVEEDAFGDFNSKVVETPYEYKELADINKISMGRSIVFEKAKEQGIDIEEIKDKSIGEALKRVSIDDVGIVHDVKKAKTDKYADNSKEIIDPKEKTAEMDKKDPKTLAEAKDKTEKPPVEPEVKPESEVKPKTETAPQTEKKIDSVINIEPVQKPESGTKSESQPKSEQKPETKPEKNTEPVQKPEESAKPESEPKTEPKKETKPETEPKTEEVTKPESDTKVEAKPEQKPETEPKPESELKKEAKPDSDIKPESEIKTEPKKEPSIAPETKPEEVSKPESEPKPEPNKEPKPEIKPETEPKPVPEPVAELKTAV